MHVESVDGFDPEHREIGAHRGPRPTGPRRSTASQCNAIYAIARVAGVNLGDYLTCSRGREQSDDKQGSGRYRKASEGRQDRRDSLLHRTG